MGGLAKTPQEAATVPPSEIQTCLILFHSLKSTSMPEVTIAALDLSLVLVDNNGKTFRLNISAPIEAVQSLTLQEVTNVNEIPTEAPEAMNGSRTGGDVVDLLDSTIEKEEDSGDEAESPEKESDEEFDEESDEAEEPDEAAELPAMNRTRDARRVL